MREQSEDVFWAFTAIADATGGIVDNSMNPWFKVLHRKGYFAN
jgi:hypothetical protein